MFVICLVILLSESPTLLSSDCTYKYKLSFLIKIIKIVLKLIIYNLQNTKASILYNFGFFTITQYIFFFGFSFIFHSSQFFTVYWCIICTISTVFLPCAFYFSLFFSFNCFVLLLTLFYFLSATTYFVLLLAFCYYFLSITVFFLLLPSTKI